MVTTVSIYSCNEISMVTTSAVTFDVVTCVDPSNTTFTLSPEFTDLHTINIYSNNCPYVSTFSLSGLASLQTIVIGTNAFTVFPNSYNYNPNRSFHITNCPELLFLRFYPYSFSDYSGEFELASIVNESITSRLAQARGHPIRRDSNGERCAELRIC